ncbi:MAG: putative branched-chain-amino-acid aminotransferase [Pseudomonadota bacterium]|jgi:branched-chain amino acid aminotransferase
MTLVWLDGALIPAGEARIDPADRGFLLSDGVFETLCHRGDRIHRLAAHLARLRDGCRILGIPLDRTDDALADGLAAVAQAPFAQGGGCSLRLTVTAGVGRRGLLRSPGMRPTVLITAAPLPAPPGPARLIIATVTRRNEHSPLSRVKSLNYLDGILAREEAAARGADDAVLLNTAGRVAEATAANLFLEIDCTWVTPPVSEGALPGTMRAAMIVAWGAVERPVTVADLHRADRIVLTNALGLRDVAGIQA